MSESAAKLAPGWKDRLAHLRRPDFWTRVDTLLRTWGPLLLLVFAVCYYGQYYRSGLNLGGEGGTVAVNAMRLNEGWLPIKDTVLNYNVLWFYPVAWLFKITGPNYLALRFFFFALCTLSGLLAFVIMRRVTGLGWYALGVGLLILAIPGMQFRNYVGLLPLLNIWVLLHALVLESDSSVRRWCWFAGAGLVLGLTFLIRIEEGFFFALIYLGLVALYPLGVRGAFFKRLPVAIGAGLVCVFAVVAVHLPFYLDAKKRGFGPEFIGQYSTMWNQIRYEVDRRLPGPRHATLNRMRGPAVVDQRIAPEFIRVGFAKTPAVNAVSGSRDGRPRGDLRDLFKQSSFDDTALILLLYLPILVGGIFGAVAGVALLWALVTASEALKKSSLVCLVTLGAALTLFSQYFFFRPDSPHLSEFMVPFQVAVACASYFAVRFAWTSRWSPAAIACFAFVLLCAAAEVLYIVYALPKESAGTIGATRKHTYEFSADNGVHVLVKRSEQIWLPRMHDIIVKSAAPDDWVITFPYSPTINFMTNRRSYLKNLYVDNATADGRADSNFTRNTIHDIESFKPAVIVIDQRDINNTEYSRFGNWAAPLYQWIRDHYVRIGKDHDFDENEIYVRPDKIPQQS